MTEASHQMTSNPLPKNGPHKPGTVGTAQGSVQAGHHRSPELPAGPDTRSNPASQPDAEPEISRSAVFKSCTVGAPYAAFALALRC